VLLGVLAGHTEEEANAVNAPYLAEERGIEVVETTNTHARDFTDLIRVSVTGGGATTRVVGTTLGRRDRPHLLEAWGQRFNLQLEDHLALFRYEDVPGMIGRVGTVFGDRGINIASAAVGYVPEGDDADEGVAVMVVTADRARPAGGRRRDRRPRRLPRRPGRRARLEASVAGATTCPECGSAVSAYAAGCDGCGADLEAHARRRRQEIADAPPPGTASRAGAALRSGVRALGVTRAEGAVVALTAVLLLYLPVLAIVVAGLAIMHGVYEDRRGWTVFFAASASSASSSRSSAMTRARVPTPSARRTPSRSCPPDQAVRDRPGRRGRRRAHGLGRERVREAEMRCGWSSSSPASARWEPPTGARRAADQRELVGAAELDGVGHARSTTSSAISATGTRQPRSGSMSSAATPSRAARKRFSSSTSWACRTREDA
jgi:hypothetical protein